MKKILKGSVVETEEGVYFWVVDHRKGFIKALNMNGKEEFVGEAMCAKGSVYTGEAAMEIVKKVFY